MLEHLSYGQSDFFVGAVAIAVYLLTPGRGSTFRRRRILLAGFLMALALTTKPAALLLFLGLAWDAELGVFTAGAAMVLALFCITGLVMMADGAPWSLMTLTGQWLTSLGQQPSVLFGGNLTQGLGAVLARNLGHMEWSKSFSKGFFFGGTALFAACLARGVARRKLAESQRCPFELLQKLSVSMGVFLLCNPLSWRWNTFLWLPVAYFVVLTARKVRKKPQMKVLQYGLLGGFAVLALLSQTWMAHLVGVAEVDDMSHWGVYGWASLLLTAAAILALDPRARAR
jgi:hypothetical protein